ncbi:hypothetical protein BDZ97DRAFT_1833466 [Flammula alnicola]|nr:hypothetical protein BDZ97DRAFT_1833466 [Flammula alnicola]
MQMGLVKFALLAITKVTILGQSTSTNAVDATIADVHKRLDGILPLVSLLDRTVTEFPASGGSVRAAWAMHTQGRDVLAVLDKATYDIEKLPKPIPKDDQIAILRSIQDFQPFVLHALAELIVKKPIFSALSKIGGGVVSMMVEQDLAAFQRSMIDFESSFDLDSFPAEWEELRTHTDAITEAINEAISAALAAYS